jgi:hypothetical protein
MVECVTDLTLFYHLGFILFIEMHSQNTKNEDREIDITDVYYIILQMLENFFYSLIDR